jgi:hypothetical protein
MSLAGCGGQPEAGTESPYRAEFDAALAESSSDFVTGVLSDYVITAEEFEESFNEA